jgi:Na+-driven multidrug efflux pump
MLLASTVFLLFAEPLIALFRNDGEVIAIGAPALRAQGLAMLCHGLITCTILLAQAIGKPIQASILAGARQGFFFVPLLFFFQRRFGVGSIILVQPIADGLTFLLALPFAVALIRRLSQKNSAESPLSKSPLRLR